MDISSSVAVLAAVAVVKSLSSLLSSYFEARRHVSEVSVRLQGTEGTDLKIDAGSLTPEAREKLLKLFGAMQYHSPTPDDAEHRGLRVTISAPENAP